MPRQIATGLAFVLAAFFAAVLAATLLAAPAHAVIQGTSSSLGAYTVRLIGNGNCTGVVIARRAVVTAAHCARGMRVMADGGTVRVTGVSRSALLDDGRRVSVSGDAAILTLAAPLSGVGAAPVGAGSGDSFTIAGYGTQDERAARRLRSLHEATLVPAGARALVDPNRKGSIGASACFGDSGGPVMRGGMLVGIITRAAHPSPRIACGDLTRWAAITVSGSAREILPAAERHGRRRAARTQTPPPRPAHAGNADRLAQPVRQWGRSTRSKLTAPSAARCGTNRPSARPPRYGVACAASAWFAMISSFRSGNLRQHFIQERGVNVVDRHRHLLGVILVVLRTATLLQQAQQFLQLGAAAECGANDLAGDLFVHAAISLTLFPALNCADCRVGATGSYHRREIVRHQLAANFISLMASKSCTPPPTRLVV